MKYIELPTAKKARIRRALGVSRVTLLEKTVKVTPKKRRKMTPKS